MQFIAWIFKIFFSLLGLVFVLGTLCILLLALISGALWSLVRGRKPEVAVVWQRYQDMARNKAPFGAWRTGPQHAPEVVDVEVKEVTEVPHSQDRLPKQ
ncbi:MAG: hypothetical protein WCH92_08990 [Betaproteobacteria bacterium]|jgi:hypothetical protein